MKKIFLLKALVLINIISFSQNTDRVSAKLRELKNDTTAYLKSKIIDQKDRYKNQPFDSLLRDLPLIVEYVNTINHNRRYLFSSTTFYFAPIYKVSSQVSKREIPSMIIVEWKKPVENKGLVVLDLNDWNDDWSAKAYEFYKKLIIADILTMDYVSE